MQCPFGTRTRLERERPKDGNRLIVQNDGYMKEKMMTTKADFTNEEWTVLLQALPSAASYVITADLSVIGAMREARALAKALEEPSVPPAAQELADSVMADVVEKSANKEKVDAVEIKESEYTRQALLRSLEQAAAALDAKCSPEEAAGFKQWLLDLATAVAKADKEGSHFGIGGVRVTDKEKAALAEIASVFGLESS
jgi:hypothetical protein